MKQKQPLIVILLCLLSLGAFAQIDPGALKCKASEMNKQILQASPEAMQEYQKLEEFTKSYVKQLRQNKIDHNEALIASPTYIIPVVFHVFGTNFAGSTVTQAKVEQALLKLNEDFQGLNSDFNTVDSQFAGIKQSLSIEFRLAKIDPNGNSTTGVKFYGALNGFGNGGGYDSQIQQYAWDNYKYMNVYIQLDLYNDGSTTNSGVAWYPNTYMSNNNTARVVYNGRYLHGNTNDEFASVLTHEFGHWLNLIHTFEGGCSSPNDQVSDTPAENSSTSNGCSPATNCYGQYINYENYMGYNGASGCYKMYTQGQVNRMLAALQHPARQPLWQESNLIATGTSDGGGTTVTAPSGLSATAASSSQINLTWNDNSNNETGFAIERASGGGSYSTIANLGANSTSYSNTGLSASTTYTYRVRAYSGSTYSSYSNTSSATTSGGGTSYCTISGNASYEYINKVNIGSFSNTSGSNSGYGNYTSQTASLAAGSNVSVVLTPGFSGSSYREYWSVWIDYDKDNTFEASELVISGLNGTGAVSGNFTVSSTATGTTRMRVVMKYNSAPTAACGNIGDGEAEDYTVTFSGSSNSLATPGNIRSAGTYASGFYAGWGLVSGATGYDVQLYSGSSWQAQGTSTTYYLWIPKQGSTTSYTFRVRAKNSSETSAWSNSFTVTLPAAGPDPSGLSPDSFSVYPNPNKTGLLSFNIPYTEGEDYVISIYDAQGKLADQVKNRNTHTISHLKKGLYLIKFSQGSSEVTQRLVIE
ncbi:GEVED domain-containing protein [Fulvivirga ulvae]|uniref:zinc-dependent metalloprotease n=1 Tax=Fulvivirga ulvae TaxID=2904245 RepID=UPI001EEDC457|nr:M43 family zinc metalloprotease [Fulvivirga ulvae]UII34639.1 GEVED domain-containing protein [Fulvivirga ulvae]